MSSVASASDSSERPYDGQAAGVGLLARVPYGVLLAAGLALILLSMVGAIGVGAVAIAPGDVVAAVVRGATGAAQTGPHDYIVVNLRAPRVVQAVIVGAALAAAGVIVQAIVQNPIADPYILGLSSGASLGAVLVITTLGLGLLGALTLPMGAFAGAILAGVCVYLLARSPTGGLQAGPLVMIGIALGSLLAGLTSFLVLRAGNAEATQDVMFWLLGSLSGAQWRLVTISGALVTCACVILLLTCHRLTLLMLGDDTATALGLRPGQLRAGFFVLAALLTATAVSVSGAIGFVGLVMPNLTRLLVGADHRRVAPLAMVLGALLMLLADTAARTVIAPTEVPIGIVTAFIGVPVFVIVIRRTQVA